MPRVCGGPGGCLCVSFWFEAGIHQECLWGSLGVYRCYSPKDALQWPESCLSAGGPTVGSGCRLSSLAWEMGFQPAGQLAALCHPPLRRCLLHPAECSSWELGSCCGFCSLVHFLLDLRSTQPGSRSLEGTQELSEVQAQGLLVVGLGHMAAISGSGQIAGKSRQRSLGGSDVPAAMWP